MNENPYASPQAEMDQRGKPSPPRVNWLRGIKMALVWGFPAFLLVPVFGLSVTDFGINFAADLVSLKRTMPGAVILAVVFGGAAMANYAPEKGIGFVRCLIVMGGLSLASGVVVSWLSPYFGYAQSYGLMDSPGFATFLAVGMSIAPIIATLSLIFRNNAEH